MADETSAHTEAPGHAGGFPPFNKETFAEQLFWFAIFFVALYWITSRLALPRVGSIIEGRKNRISGDLAEATRLKDKTNDAIASYEKALAEARARAQNIAADTHAKLQAEAEQNRKTVEDRLNMRLAEADKAIAATKIKAMGNVRGIAIDAASTIVAQLTGVTAAEKTVSDAVDDVLKR